MLPKQIEFCAEYEGQRVAQVECKDVVQQCRFNVRKQDHSQTSTISHGSIIENGSVTYHHIIHRQNNAAIGFEGGLNRGFFVFLCCLSFVTSSCWSIVGVVWGSYKAYVSSAA